MTQTSPKASVDVLVAMVLDPGGGTTLEQLALALDELAVGVARLTVKFDETDWPDPPDLSYNEVYQAVQAAFPRLGLYAQALGPLDAESLEMGTGDAVDDLADIVLDLAAARWRWANTSADDALWHLRTSFEQHWGTHLQALQKVVHALRTKAD